MPHPKPLTRLPNLMPEQGQRETCRNCGQVICYSGISETWWHLKTEKHSCEPKHAEPLELREGVMPDKPHTTIEANISELSPAEISASNALFDAHNRMWALGPKRRKNIYHRWEMLKLFTPEMSRLFEQNIRRINSQGGE